MANLHKTLRRGVSELQPTADGGRRTWPSALSCRGRSFEDDLAPAAACPSELCRIIQIGLEEFG